VHSEFAVKPIPQYAAEKHANDGEKRQLKSKSQLAQKASRPIARLVR